MSAVAEAIGVSRQHLSAMRNRPTPGRRGRPPLPDAELVVLPGESHLGGLGVGEEILTTLWALADRGTA